MIKFSCVSVISTIVAQGTLWIVFYNLRLWSAVPSNIFANAMRHPSVLHAQQALGLGQVGTFALLERGSPLLDACRLPEWRFRSGRFRLRRTSRMRTTWVICRQRSS